MTTTTEIRGWGGVSRRAVELLGEDLRGIASRATLSRGLGRSYGDSSLPPRDGDVVAGTVLADRVLALDPDSGRIRAEAGLSLQALNAITLPLGLFTPVSPGTQYVTLGGMVAGDVHGKNHHHDGCFGEHVTELRLLTAEGDVVDCSPERHGELFRATLGGLGLTGHLLEVEFRLAAVPSPWIYQESRRLDDLDAVLAGLEESRSWPLTAAWIDSLSRRGRGILFRGRWAEPDEAPAQPPSPRARLSIPFRLPSWVMSRPAVRLFNLAFWRKHVRRRRAGIVAPGSFFYPLDAVGHWNRAYGRRGFIQYQCVIPEEAGVAGAREFLTRFIDLNGVSFLTVVKDCGPEGRGMLSFPRPGTSIALDIPRRPDTRELVDRLNELLLELGGRINPVKDALTRGEHYRAMEPRLQEWQRVRRRWDPVGKLASAQSVRYGIDPPRDPGGSTGGDDRRRARPVSSVGAGGGEPE